MLSPPLGRFLSRDPLPQSGEPDILFDNNAFGDWLNLMLSRYGYARSNPTSRIDPHGLADAHPPCSPEDPPASIIPPEDDWLPTATWATPKPQAHTRNSGNLIGFGSPSFKFFRGATCDCCAMDIVLIARAYRYYRYNSATKTYVSHTGAPLPGFVTDPRDFVSLAIITVCKTNIVCKGNPNPRSSKEAVVSEPLQKNGLGVFIRQLPGDIASTLTAFANAYTGDDCDYAEDAIRYINTNARPSPA